MDDASLNIGEVDSTSSKLANIFDAKEGVVVERDALTIDIEDVDFIRVANRLITQSKNFYRDVYKLDYRRQEMEKYLFGRQLNDLRLADYQAKYTDNIIYEAEAYLKPMVMSRMPDLLVKPGGDDDQSRKNAEDLTKMIGSELDSRERKRVMGMAFKHLPVYFVGVIKYFWNPEKGKDGDYDFKVVHPENIVMDHTAISNDVRDMDYIAEYIEYSVKEWVMKFPKKEQQFYAALRKNGIFNNNKDEKTEAGMQTKVKGVEIWFNWYEKKGDSWERLSCVGWFYKDLVLDRIKNPNWDWQGQQNTFIASEDGSQKTPSAEQLMTSLVTNNFQGMSTKTVYNNYLESPEFPYIVLGYDQWGKTPIDETSRIEQNIYKQQNYDKRGAIITDKLNQRGKHIFSSNEGFKAEDLEKLDLNNPRMDVLLKGDVNKVHAFIPPEMVEPSEFQILQHDVERIFATAGVNGPVRGQVDTQDVATTTQIAREGDFSRADDLADDTINYAAEKMANAILQLIKLRYTKDHLVSSLGDDGETVFRSINQDMVSDGMAVTVFASGTDKLKAEQQAMDMAKLQVIDPYSFYKDIGAADPKNRTKLLILWSDPNMRALYAQELGIDINSQGGVAALAGQLPQGQPGGQPPGGQPQPGQDPQQGANQAQADIQQIMQGQIPQPPQVVDPGYLQVFTQFMQDPNGAQALIAQHPEIKSALLQFAKQVETAARQGGGASIGAGQTALSGPTQPTPSGAPGQVGPVANANPSPGNTSQVAITPPARNPSMVG